MTQINETRFMTIGITADEVYKINTTAGIRLNILNGTDGDLYIGNSADFTSDEGVDRYVTLPADNAINNVEIPFPDFYLKATASGKVAIARC